MSRMPRVSIAGGSVGGLTAALVLRDAGCDVRVFERSSTALQARGAGIAALDTTLDYLLTRGGFQAADVCSSTGWIRFLGRDGSVQHEQPHRYRFSSWNTIYRSLLSLLEADRYELGTEVTGFTGQDAAVTVTLSRGTPTPARASRPTCWSAPTASARPPGPGCCPGSAPPTPGTWPGAAPCPSMTSPPVPARSSATRSPTRCCPAATSSCTRSPPWTVR